MRAVLDFPYGQVAQVLPHTSTGSKSYSECLALVLEVPTVTKVPLVYQIHGPTPY